MEYSATSEDPVVRPYHTVALLNICNKKLLTAVQTCESRVSLSGLKIMHCRLCLACLHCRAQTETEDCLLVAMVQNVLVCGWGDSTFMISLLHSMDAELPRNSQITLLNLQRKEDVLGESPEVFPVLRNHLCS